ncbi:hypothetical protein D3C80_2137080 [compost metagenome]
MVHLIVQDINNTSLQAVDYTSARDYGIIIQLIILKHQYTGRGVCEGSIAVNA